MLIERLLEPSVERRPHARAALDAVPATMLDDVGGDSGGNRSSSSCGGGGGGGGGGAGRRAAPLHDDARRARADEAAAQALLRRIDALANEQLQEVRARSIQVDAFFVRVINFTISRDRRSIANASSVGARRAAATVDADLARANALLARHATTG